MGYSGVGMKVKNLSLVLIATVEILGFTLNTVQQGFGQTGKEVVLKIKKTSDFSVDGKGSSKNWENTDWILIKQRSSSKRMSKNEAPKPVNTKPPARLTTRAKILYSNTGIYFLIRSEDRMLQATMDKNFMELWWEDVVEIFLWPDEKYPAYFEYQLSPLNYVRMTERKRGHPSKPLVAFGKDALHQTSVKGGKKQSGTLISQWTAEVFMPYKLLQAAHNVSPDPGTRWRVNLIRFDYDTGDRSKWAWQPVDGSNHNLEKYGTFLFE